MTAAAATATAALLRASLFEQRMVLVARVVAVAVAAVVDRPPVCAPGHRRVAAFVFRTAVERAAAAATTTGRRRAPLAAAATTLRSFVSVDLSLRSSQISAQELVCARREKRKRNLLREMFVIGFE